MNKNLKKLVTLVATVGIVTSQTTAVMASDLQVSDFETYVSDSKSRDTTADGDWNYSIIEDGTVRIDEYKGISGNVLIPDTIEVNGKNIAVTDIYRCI